MNTEKTYSGVVIPMITPLNKKYQIDDGAVEKLFDRFHNAGVHPFILGTTGEASSFSISFKKNFLRTAGRIKKPGTTLYAGISSNCLEESIDLAKLSFEHGADVVVSTLPSYYSLSEAAMLRYFEQLAEAIPGPMMIYNIPATTNMSIPLSVVDRLSHHPRIVGLKDSERSEERLQQSIELWKERKDFSHLLGWAAKSAVALLKGSDGLVPSTGNIYPELYSYLYKDALVGNKESAIQYQELSDELGDLYQKGRTLAESLWALKSVMNSLHLCEAIVMPPLYEGKEEDAEKLKNDLQLIMKKAAINII